MVANLTVLNTSHEKEGSPSFSPSGCNPNGKCGNGLEKIYPTCAVRYGYMSYIGEFKYAAGMLFGCGAKVVIQSERGIEIGQQVSLTCTGCDKSVKRQTMLEYVRNSGPDFMRPKSGRILRLATDQDIQEERRINQDADLKLLRAKELARKQSLPMKFVLCEHLFGGERIIFHFMAEGRIDFRELVREMAHEFHTRIEMHQVGARDEARLVADYEICGRECCCKNFLKTLRPVTMRMAKLQKATLDPSKVSGRCGRLRCCLRYEHEGYEDLNQKLPRVGHRVHTDRGPGTIRDRQVLTQLVSIEYDADNFIETVGIEDLLAGEVPQRPAPDLEQTPRRDNFDRPRGPSNGGQRPRPDARPPQRPPQPGGPPQGAPPQSGDIRGGPPSNQPPGEQRSGRRSRRGRRGRRGRGPQGGAPGSQPPGYPPSDSGGDDRRCENPPDSPDATG